VLMQLRPLGGPDLQARPHAGHHPPVEGSLPRKPSGSAHRRHARRRNRTRRMEGTGNTPALNGIQHRHFRAVNRRKSETSIRLRVRPGSFVDATGRSSCRRQERAGRNTRKAGECFTIGDERHVESDPRCGLLMLAEVADRVVARGERPGTTIAVSLTPLTRNGWTPPQGNSVIFRRSKFRRLTADLLDDGIHAHCPRQRGHLRSGYAVAEGAA
jgi:hypothetical protein